MASENDPFAASVRAKIAAWQAVLESYETAIALDGPLPEGAGPAGGGSPTPRGKAIDLPVGIFRDKSIKDAIALYLEAGRRKQTNKEIAEGLKRGGIATTSTNFEATVGTALFRLKNEGKVLRFDDGWDLAASYPDSLRGRLGAKDKPRKAKRPARRPATAKAQKATQAATDVQREI